jgi:FtsH-binding integral membrane protein
LFGTAGMHVHAAILSNHASVQIVYNLQVAGIVAAHVMAVVIAHVLAVRQADTPKQAIFSQIPMTALMIGYTVFGLWLLSSPTVG